jgi:predicted O-methyltransferase YrrM
MPLTDSVARAVGRARRSPVGARARMAAATPRLALSGDRTGRAIARAVRDASLGRVDEGDRHWVERIEARRERLLAEGGATGPAFDPGRSGPDGAFSMGQEQTTVGVASAFMSLQRAWCLLLFRLARDLRPRSCLELGTGFGISGSYLAAALERNGEGRLTTLEGSEDWARHALEGFRELGLAERVDLRVGPIAASLRDLPDASGSFDFAFIDAEHQAAATLEEFDAVLPRLVPGAVVVIDDVNWKPVRDAFDQLAGHERIALALAVGRLGLIVTTGAGAA